MSPKFDWDDYDDAPAAAAPAAGASKFNWDDHPDAPDSPGAFDGLAKSAIDSLPAVGGVAGGILGTPLDAVSGPMGSVVGAAMGGYAGTAAKNLINRYYDPASAPQTQADAMTQPIIGGAQQGLMQGAGEVAAPYIGSAAQGTADALKSFAAKKAIAATGATGAQAAKFAPDAGQALLDQGIVRFGNSQAKVAQNATDALDASGKKIGDILTDLDSKGATVDQSDVIDALRKRATDLGKRSSQYGVSDSLNKLADRMQSSIEASGGNSEIPLTEAEQIKREFQASANYNSTPNDLSHAKEVAGIYRQAVEDAATKLDPKAGEAFAAEKKAYSLLSPVQEAAAKRASTVAQSPHGGLMDTVASIAGEGIGGIPGAIAAPIARRAVATRIAPTLAAAADTAGNIAGAVPLMARRAVPIALQAPAAAVPAAINSGEGAIMALPAAAKNDSNAATTSAVAQGAPANRAPSGGPDAWASQGIQKLGIQDAGLSSRLLADPKAKQLLIQASDLAPGSKAMKQIMSQIQKGWGQ